MRSATGLPRTRATEVPNVSGGCRCGRVRYEVDAAGLPRTYACHCLDCQTWCGSAFSQQFVAAEADLRVSGAVAEFDLAGGSGRVSRQRACPSCFTRIFNTNTARPGLAIIRAGTLDDSRDLACAAHIWVRSKQPWVVIPDDARTWPEAADPAELLQCLGIGQPP